VSTIQINYDLRQPTRDYQPVYDYIKAFPGWCRLLKSCWLVRTSKTAGEVRDDLKRLVDSNDEVATFDVTGDSWATNWSDERTTWLHNNMGYAQAA
jgi:hypothetical protein